MSLYSKTFCIYDIIPPPPQSSMPEITANEASQRDDPRTGVKVGVLPCFMPFEFFQEKCK